MLFSGGMNSSNYAGYACSAFPLCSPDSSFSFFWDKATKLFLWNGWLGLKFSSSILEWIHLTHRLVTIVGSIIFFYFIFSFFLNKGRNWKFLGISLLILLLLEIFVGITNALFSVPIPISILHTTIASCITGVLAIMLAKAKYYN